MTRDDRPQMSVRLKVPFHDLDPLRVVWHGNYLKYFEIAREALFDELGVDLCQVHRDAGFAFPIVRSAVKHVHPLRYHDEFDCTARLVGARTKIELEFEVRRADGKLCARGRTEQVAVRVTDGELQLRIPEPIRAALGEKA